MTLIPRKCRGEHEEYWETHGREEGLQESCAELCWVSLEITKVKGLESEYADSGALNAIHASGVPSLRIRRIIPYSSGG